MRPAALRPAVRPLPAPPAARPTSTRAGPPRPSRPGATATPAHSGVGGTARGGALNLAGAGYAALAGFAVSALVARGLPPAAAGVFFTATAGFGVCAVIAKLGTPTGLVYWLARLRTHGRADLVWQCLNAALGPVVVASVAVGAAGWLAAGWFAGAELAELVRILALALPLAAVSDVLLAATRGYRTMRPTVLVDRLARPTLQLAGLLLVFVLGAPLPWYAVAWAAPWLVTVPLATRTLHPLLPVSSRAGTGMGRRFWRFTWARGVANVVQLALQRLDVVLVAAFLGFAPAAAYAVATRFTVVGQLGNAAIGSAAEPRLVEALTRGDRRTAKALYGYATAWLILAAWPVYLLTAAFAPLYLGIFGPAYATAEATAVVVLLCAAMLVASGCGAVDTVLAMTGRTTWNLANVSAALAVNLGLNLVLLPRLGILGAGVAWAAASLTKNLLPLGQLALRRGLHPYGKATLLAAGLTVGCFGVPPLLARLALGPSLPALLAAAGAGLLCYLAGLWALRRPLRLDSLLHRKDSR